jgi:HlyD family secretion protein
MDIQRPSSVVRNKQIRRAIIAGVALVAIVIVTVALSRLKPAAPTVDRGTAYIDTVKRGPMVRQVRGLGTLVPEDIRWIPAATDGRVERIVVYPGTPVTPDTVILELVNPTQTQALLEAEQQLNGADAQLANLRVTVANELLAQEAATGQVRAEYRQARLQAEADAELAKEGLVSALTAKLSQVRSDNLGVRDEIEQKRFAATRDSSQSRFAVQQADVTRLRALVELRRSQVSQLHVRAGMTGMLQEVKVEVGSQVGTGTPLARVADQGHLKAQLKIPETQAKDVMIGQTAAIDTRNGIIPGRVSMPDLSVDGTIELERLEDILFVGRPTYGQEQSVIRLFKVDADGVTCTRTTVSIGKTSVNTVEVKSGLKQGDQVILSDMSQYDAFDRIRLK